MIGMKNVPDETEMKLFLTYIPQRGADSEWDQIEVFKWYRKCNKFLSNRDWTENNGFKQGKGRFLEMRWVD